MTVAVIFGGKSSEHTVSIATGFLIMNALFSSYDVLPIYVDDKGVMKSVGTTTSTTLKKLKKGKVVRFVSGKPCFFVGIKRYDVACAILCLHGMNGEDGTVQGLLNSLGIPYTGSGVLASAVGLDKDFMKSRFKSENIPTLEYVKIEKSEGMTKACEKIKKLSYPVIVKPARLGSSIGISLANDESEIVEKLQNAFQYDSKVVVEMALDNFREVNCAVIKHRDKFIVSEIEEPIRSDEILSYKDKYCYGAKSAIRQIPAKLDEQTTSLVKTLALEVFRAISCSSVARVDFLIDKNGAVFVNEINTIPGSLAYYLFTLQNLDLKKLCALLIEDAVWEKDRQDGLRYEFEQGVIAGK